MFLIVFIVGFNAMPWIMMILIGLITFILLFLMTWCIFKQPLDKSWSWIGPGPPDFENLPKGLSPEDVVTQRLLYKYGHDPRTPHEQSGSRTLRTTTQKRTYEVAAGGDWLITPREMREESTEEDEEDMVFKEHDMGTSFVLEAKATREDIEGVKFYVFADALEIIIPPGNLWLHGIRTQKDDTGNRLFRMYLHDDIMPNRSWVDLWDGAVRVHMPIDYEYTSDEVHEKEMQPIIRNKPAPSLPEIPDYKKNKPSIYGLRVEESDETFEITISTEHQVRESFRYELEHNVLKVYFEEAKTQTTPTGLVIRVKKHEFLITLPAMVLRDSANYRLEGDTFHIYLHKG